uniref:Focal AT domain-containing protein n=1 Tax=Sphaeramia orbicularis TaxID=375764 RepID=A0A672ZL69_9TELE
GPLTLYLLLPVRPSPHLQVVGVTLRSLIQSVDEILPSLHRLRRADQQMRLAQQNSITSVKEESQRQMLTAAHTLALDSKNLLDAVDQDRVRANFAEPRPDSPGPEGPEE